MINPDALREAAVCCAACGRDDLYLAMIGEARSLEAAEKERKAPFNVSDADRAAMLGLINDDRRAEACKLLRSLTNRSLRACLDYVNTLGREAAHV